MPIRLTKKHTTTKAIWAICKKRSLRSGLLIWRYDLGAYLSWRNQALSLKFPRFREDERNRDSSTTRLRGGAKPRRLTPT